MASARGTPFGRYVLGDRLAVGGMGEVYLAVQLGLGDFEKPLAIKLLLPHLSEDPQSVQMFLHEANLAVRMHHPNVVEIFDVGIQDGRYYIAMELVRGVSLSALIRALAEAKEPMPAALVTYIAHGLLDGLHHAHELGDHEGRPLDIVHRDVSPQNLLLSLRGEVKLADFGIAKARNTEGHTRTGMVKGKMEYLAPEQFDGQPASRRTDVFSAAVTIFQAATLRSPFRRETDGATMRAVMTDPLPSLRAERPELAVVSAALSKAMVRDPSGRTTSAAQLKEEIGVLPPGAPAKELAALIALHCANVIDKLDHQTAHTALLGREHTQPATVQGSAPGPRARAGLRKAPWAIGTVALLAAAGSVVVALRPSPSVVASPEVRVAQPAPAPEASQSPPPAPAPLPVSERPPPPLEPSRSVRAAARPSPGRAIGYLTVDALPWAKVFIRQQKIGDTPLYRFPINEGEVSVRLENPENGKTVTKRVKVVRAREASIKEDLR